MTEPKEGNVSRSKSEEIITFNATAADLSEKKARVASADNRMSPSIKKFSIRKSVDSRLFEIVGPDKLEDQNLEASLQQQTPIVKLNRISSPVKSSSALEPNEIALITASLPEVTNSTFTSDDIDETMASEEVATPPMKTLNREMKNLQQSANSSKVLSNFLTNSDTPRRRKNKERSIHSVDAESEELATIETDSYASTDFIDREVPLKHSPISNNESDSTIVLQDENNVQKRRKSTGRRSRSRSRSRSSKGGRPKSMSKMMNDELAVASDKEENDENDDVDDTLYAQPRTFDNRAPNPPPKPGWDSYCFKCHVDNAVLSLACSKCKCSYHRACVRSNPISIAKKTDEFVCPECREMQAAEESDVNKFGHPKIDTNMMKEMLMTILETIRTQTGRDYFESEIPFRSTKEANPLIVKQMSYKIIEDRIMDFYYKTTESFIHDMKQLEHNWMVVDKNRAKALKPVMKYIIGDINEMESCIYCYSSAFVIGNWFSAACKRPHLLVWAKLKGYPYWPAKVMSVDADKQIADVRFFGAHDRAYIPTQQCLIYCEKDPNRVIKGTPTNNKKGIGDALQETEEYIQSVRGTYGFEFATTREVLDPKNFQIQLEKQLPKLKSNNVQHPVTDKESDAPHKEKLTLKFIRTSEVTKNAEKASKVAEKERHPLYRVLSKADSVETEVLNNTPKIASRRNTHDSEKSSKSVKKPRVVDRLFSETSESNVSTNESLKSLPHKKTPRGPAKRKKSSKSVETSPIEEPEPKRFCPPEPVITDDVEQLLEEIPAPKPIKRPRHRSRSTHEDVTPLVVSATNNKIPAGTDEIHTLRESPVASGQTRVKNRSRSFNRSQSQEKEPGKKKQRRSSAHPTSRDEEEVPSISILRRRLSSASATSKGGLSSRQRSIDAPPSIHEFPPVSSIEIKSEPTSDVEEIIETDQVTVNDIAELVSDHGAKKTTINISTSDNSNDSLQHQASRARKTFPNTISSRPSSREGSQNRSQNPMVLIPQAFGAANNQNQQQAAQGRKVNGQTLSAPGSRRNSRASTAAETPPQILPRLIPKPAGVFTQDGTNFQIETGSVSALFSENAHRMTDYFKSLLIDTIGAVSSGIPSAEITLLRLENERLKLHAQKTKNDHNLAIERMKKEHMDEIRVLRVAYEDKLKKFEENSQQDLIKAKTEIRNLCEIEKQQAIDALKKEYKKTTWCSYCLKEARYYCCWNTSYCGPSCQREHWSAHQGSCRNTNTNTTTPSARASPPSNKRTSAPTVQTTSTVAPVPQTSASNVYQNTSNATMVTPMIRKQSMPGVQTTTNTPITTPTIQYEIITTPQQPQTQQIQPSQIVLPSNTVVHRLHMLANPTNRISLNTFLQNQLATPSQDPPVLIQTKRVQVEKQKQHPKVVTQIAQPVTSYVITRSNSPPINVISTTVNSTPNLLATQKNVITNLATVNNINAATLNQTPPKPGTATLVPIISKPNNV